MVYILIGAILLLLPLLWVLTLCGQHRDLPTLSHTVYAHRGLHDATHPENSLSAFRAAAEHGFGAELDVHLLADGQLAVLHDRSLLRTAGADIDITTLTADDLSRYPLLGSEETIPLLRDVLPLFEDRAALIIELKADHGNHAALCEAVCRELDSFGGVFCLESFDPRCLIWLRRHRPEWIRGQLSQNFFLSKDVHPLLRPLLTGMVTNLFARPHFIAYRHEHRTSLPYQLCRHVWRLAGVSWTLCTQDDYDEALQKGEWPIFEQFIPRSE